MQRYSGRLFFALMRISVRSSYFLMSFSVLPLSWSAGNTAVFLEIEQAGRSIAARPVIRKYLKDSLCIYILIYGLRWDLCALRGDKLTHRDQIFSDRFSTLTNHNSPIFSLLSPLLLLSLLILRQSKRMKAYIFPGQGSQFPGMGKTLYESSSKAREIFEGANEILGFSLTDIMFNGTEEQLKQTNVTQPAIFLHSIALVNAVEDKFRPDMVAGHSLGEFSALAAASVLSWEDALRLVAIRANAMQRACELEPSAMAAILGLDDEVIDLSCRELDELVVAANYNTPGQVVISGTMKGVNKACEVLKGKGAKRAILLNVGGAFHSPLMEPAREELEEAINMAEFGIPKCAVYQNVTASAEHKPETIKKNLVAQLTSPVRWTQTINQMFIDGAFTFIEAGPGKVLQGLVKKILKDAVVESLEFTEAVEN
jgi:[acyl-carrier-protein] S-malonyltransferase